MILFRIWLQTLSFHHLRQLFVFELFLRETWPVQFTEKLRSKSFSFLGPPFHFISNISYSHNWSESVAFFTIFLHPSFWCAQSRGFQSKLKHHSPKFLQNIFIQSLSSNSVSKFLSQFTNFFSKYDSKNNFSFFFWQLDFAYKKPNIKRDDRKRHHSRSLVPE